MNSDEYLGAFMSGFEFVLLAFEGRIHEKGLDEASKARLAEFLADYQRVLAQYRAKAGATAPAPSPVVLAAMARNLN